MGQARKEKKETKYAFNMYYYISNSINKIRTIPGVNDFLEDDNGVDMDRICIELATLWHNAQKWEAVCDLVKGKASKNKKEDKESKENGESKK